LLYVGEDVYSGLWIDEFFGVEAVHEFLDGILLFDLVELDNAVFPNLI